MEAIEPVVRCALDRLLAQQLPDGSFVDFELGIGSSGPWVTASVALRLATLPDALRDRRVDYAVTAAHRYFVAEPAPVWSYNAAVPEDADSIAHVLAFLTALGERRGSAARHLAEHQRADGGFATFREGAVPYVSWTCSHLDVTPVAVRALAPYRDDPALEGVIERALPQRDLAFAIGAPAFWWDLAWYTTAMWFVAAQELGLSVEGVRVPDVEPRSDLDAAYALEVACAMGDRDRASELAQRLTRTASPDGTWPRTPALRVTLPHVTEPWQLPDREGGELYADVRGVYSAAVIISALARFAA